MTDMISPSSLYNYSVTTLASFPVVLGKFGGQACQSLVRSILRFAPRLLSSFAWRELTPREEAVTVSWTDEWLQLYEIP